MYEGLNIWQAFILYDYCTDEILWKSMVVSMLHFYVKQVVNMYFSHYCLYPCAEFFFPIRYSNKKYCGSCTINDPFHRFRDIFVWGKDIEL